VFFALEEEAWRIPAFILAYKVRKKMGCHTEEIERIESSLLGYAEEEIDAWCDHMFRKNSA
jgi:hypothetical protein